jgi:hypothetical protein
MGGARIDCHEWGKVDDPRGSCCLIMNFEYDSYLICRLGHVQLRNQRAFPVFQKLKKLDHFHSEKINPLPAQLRGQHLVVAVDWGQFLSFHIMEMMMYR